MQKALTSLPGVAKFDADTATATATIQVEKGTFDEKKAIAALADAGYPDGFVIDDSEESGDTDPAPADSDKPEEPANEGETS